MTFSLYLICIFKRASLEIAAKKQKKNYANWKDFSDPWPQSQQRVRARLTPQITQQTVCKLKDLEPSYCTPLKLLVYLCVGRQRLLIGKAWSAAEAFNVNSKCIFSGACILITSRTNKEMYFNPGVRSGSVQWTQWIQSYYKEENQEWLRCTLANRRWPHR